ncbi:unnamed protein product [Musa acuminata subsp. burmannicoides]
MTPVVARGSGQGRSQTSGRSGARSSRWRPECSSHGQTGDQKMLRKRCFVLVVATSCRNSRPCYWRSPVIFSTSAWEGTQASDGLQSSYCSIFSKTKRKPPWRRPRCSNGQT